MNISKLTAKLEKSFVREKIMRAIRDYFYSENFREVETPLLVPAVIPESYLESFKTTLLTRNRKKKTMFLTSSPEASMKKLLAAGIGNCFEITKSFRNTETGSNLHNPEFTILEWYRIPSSYTDIMKDCEKLILHIHQSLSNNQSTINNQQLTINYQGNSIDLSLPWPRLSVDEALKMYARVSLNDLTYTSKTNMQDVFSLAKISHVAKKKGYDVDRKNSWEQVFNQIFLNEVEKNLALLGAPIFIYDYPLPLAALAKVKKEDPRLAQRFELYIAGLELGDCYDESTDTDYLTERYKRELSEIKRLGKTRVKVDKEFLAAMAHIKIPYSGIAVGVDRLCMLFADTARIQDVLLFPVQLS